MAVTGKDLLTGMLEQRKTGANDTTKATGITGKQLIAGMRLSGLSDLANRITKQANGLQGNYNMRYADDKGNVRPTTWRADSSAWLDYVSGASSALNNDIMELNSLLSHYGSYLSEEDLGQLTALSGQSSNLGRDILDQASREKEAFSQFENADQYNAAAQEAEWNSKWSKNTPQDNEVEWNNLQRNLTIAFGDDNADAIDATNRQLTSMAYWILESNDYKDTDLAVMAEDFIYNRNKDQYDKLEQDYGAALLRGAQDAAQYADMPISQFARYGSSMNNEEAAAIKAEQEVVQERIREYERSPRIKEMENINLRKQEDYEERSSARDYGNPSKEELDTYDRMYNYNMSETAKMELMSNAPKINDPLGIYINSTQTEKDNAIIETANAHEQGKISTYNEYVSNGISKRWDLLTENEINDYYYHLSESIEAGMKYLEGMTEVLNERAITEYEKELDELPLGSKVFLSAAASIPKVIFGPAEGVRSGLLHGIELLTGQDNLYDKEANPITSRIDLLRQNTTEQIDESEKTFLGVSLGEIFSGVISSLDSMAAAGLDTMVGAGGMLGGSLLGADAARMEMDKLYDEGASVWEVVQGGVKAYWVEYLTEKFSIGVFAEGITSGVGKTFWKKVAQFFTNIGTNMTEEAASEMLNAAGDQFIRGSQSDYNKIVRAEMENGKTREEAQRIASREFWSRVWSSAVGGAIGGGMMGSVSVTYSSAAYSTMNTQYANSIIENNRVDRVISNAESVSAELKQNSGMQKRLDKAIRAVREETSVKSVKNLLRQLDIATAKVSAKALSQIKLSRKDKASLRQEMNYSPENVAVNQMAFEEAVIKNARRKYAVGTGTTNRNTGEDIEIVGIHRTREKGKPTLVFNLKDGNTIKAEDVSYSSANKAIVAEAIAETGIRADYAMDLFNSVTEESEGAFVAQGIQDAIRSGMINENYAIARKTGYAADLTDAQFKTAYKAGQSLAKDGFNRAKGRASQKTASDVNLNQENGKLVGSFYDGTKTPVSALKNGEGARTLTNTSGDGTVSSDDVKNMARNSKYMEYFPSSHKNGDTHYWCTMWARSDLVKSGEYSVVGFGGKYYEIQKHDDADFGYRIIRSLTASQVKRMGGLYSGSNAVSATNKSRGSVYDSARSVKAGYETIQERRADDYSPVRDRSADDSIHGLGDRAHSGDGKNSLRRDRSDVRSQRRAQGSADPNTESGQTVKTTKSKKADGEPTGLSVAIQEKGILRATTQAQMNVLESIAKITNTNIEVYASQVVNGRRQFTDRRGKVHYGNAAYTRQGNTIMVDIHAGDYLNGLVLNAVSHELVHYIAEMSPEKFRKLADFVVAKFGEKGMSVTKLIHAKQSKYAAQGEELSFMDAYEEVVADSVESMLSQKTDKIVSDIAEMRKVDADLAKTFVDKVKDLVGKMLNVFRKNKFESNPETEEGKLFAEWSEFSDELSGIFAEAAADAADQAALAARRTDTVSENKKSADDAADGVKYSFRNSASGAAHDILMPYDQELRSYIEARGDVIVDTHDKLIDVVNRAFDNPKENFTAYFGVLPYSTLRVIEQSIPNIPRELNGHLFKVGRNYSIAIESDNIIHLTDDKTAMTREDVVDFLDRVADIIIEHDSVAFDYYYSNKQKTSGINFKKNYADGVFTSFSLVSAGKRSIKPQTIYMDSVSYVKRKSANPLPMQTKALAANVPQNAHSTSMTRGGQTSTTIVSNPAEKINPSDEKSSLRNVTNRQIIAQMIRDHVEGRYENATYGQFLECADELEVKQYQAEELRRQIDKQIKRGNKPRAGMLRGQLRDLKEEIAQLENQLDGLEQTAEIQDLKRTLTKENTPADAEVKNMVRNTTAVVDLSNDNRLAKIIGGRYGSARYNIIRDYILDELKDQPIRMSDGKMAIVDRGDAQHIASRGRHDDKVAQIAHIQQIIENAKLVAEENSTKDRKFDYYWYYETQVKYKGEVLPLYVNLGKAGNGSGYHIYDLTNKLRDTAHRVNDVGRPFGNALKSGISINSISDSAEKSNPSNEKNSLRNISSRQLIAQMIRDHIEDQRENATYGQFLECTDELEVKQYQAEELRRQIDKQIKRGNKPRAGMLRGQLRDLKEEIAQLENQLDGLEQTAEIQDLKRTLTKENTPADAEVKNMVRNDLSHADQEAGKKFADFVEGVNKMIDRSKISKRKHKIGGLSVEHRKIIDDLMRTIYPDFTSDGYELWIDGTGADHIEKRHGKNGEKDHTMQFREDKELVPWVANSPDGGEFIRNKDGSIRTSDRFRDADDSRSLQIRLRKKTPGGTVFVSECVIDGSNKRIYITSAYKTKDSTNRVLNMESSSLQPTSKTPTDNRAINDSISDTAAKSNPQTEKNSLRNVTNRQIIAQMIRDHVEGRYEKGVYNKFLAHVDELDAKQEKLDAIIKERGELYYTKRTSQTRQRMAQLEEQARQLTAEIDAADRKLTTLEVLKPFRDMVENARKRQKEADDIKEAEKRRERLRRASVDKVVRVMKDINRYIQHNSKEKHIPIDLLKPITEAMNSFNLDWSAGGNRLVKDYLNDVKKDYEKILNDPDPLVSGSYDEEITNMLAGAVDVAGDTSIHDMSQEQLDSVYQVFKALRSRITKANRMSAENIRETIGKLEQNIEKEIRDIGPVRELGTDRGDRGREFVWNELKPIYAFRRIGSPTLMRLFQNLLDGQYQYAMDLEEANAFRLQVDKKYGASKWKLDDTHTFKDRNGTEFDLTLGQILSVYATSRREQGLKHLFGYGIVSSRSVEITKKNKLGRAVKYHVNEQSAHPLDIDSLADIVETLTDDQKSYVEEMQAYLSEVMGAKGNEISLKLYEMKMFGEKNYFPLHTAAWWNAFNPEAGVERKIKSPAWSKQTNKHAKSPIVVEVFDDVWSRHVDEMSMYHSMALPVDDITRIMNCRNVNEGGGVGGVRQALEDVFGPAPGQYISTLLRDLNGGIRMNPGADVVSRGVTKAKKAATMLSLSVAIQQSSSVMRAMAYIDAKYFVKSFKSNLDLRKHNRLWEELKNYSGVAIIKEMGGFDAGLGRAAREWLKKKEYEGFAGNIKALFSDKAHREDVMGYLPAIMDELAWVQIWNAAKAEIAATTDLTGKDLLKAAGRRFNEIIELTQVYDSTLSRSGHMRAQDTGAKMATAFMAEPTVVINMLYDAALGVKCGRPGAWKHLARTIGSNIGSMVLNALLKSIITAMRDDDDDKTYLEKYLKAFVGNFFDDFFLYGHIPFIRDIASIIQGYNVERMDMALVSDLTKSIQRAFNDGTTVEEVIDIILSAASFFGLPLANLKRDIKGFINSSVAVFVSDRKATGAGLLNAAKEGWSGKDTSNEDQLYNAYLSGDPVAIQQTRSLYKTESDADSALISALRANDKRVQQAGQYRFEGNMLKQGKLINEIVAEGYFTQAQVMKAVLGEAEACKEKQEPEEKPYDGTYEEVKDTTDPMSYTNADLKYAMERGDQTEDIIESIVADKMSDGRTRSQALGDVKGTVIGTYRGKYLEAYASGDKDEMERIQQIMIDTGLWNGSTAVKNVLSNWIKNEEENK